MEMQGKLIELSRLVSLYIEVEVCFFCLSPVSPELRQDLNHVSVGPKSSQNKASDCQVHIIVSEGIRSMIML